MYMLRLHSSLSLHCYSIMLRVMAWGTTGIATVWRRDIVKIVLSLMAGKKGWNTLCRICSEQGCWVYIPRNILIRYAMHIMSSKLNKLIVGMSIIVPRRKFPFGDETVESQLRWQVHDVVLMRHNEFTLPGFKYFNTSYSTWREESHKV